MAKSPKVDLYCICGNHSTLTFKVGTTPAQIQRTIHWFWKSVGCVGDGHAPCDKRTATQQQRATEAQSEVLL